MTGCYFSRRPWLSAAVLVLAVGTPAPTLAQTMAPGDASAGPAPSGGSNGDWNVGESSVGYIDNAIPGNQFRLRYDAAYHNNRPTRADFFWPGVGGPPLPEVRVDYQDITSYLEAALSRRFSVFVEAPVRFLNPERNDNTAGFGDMNAGFKWAFLFDRERVATFQLRTYAPTGDADRGLGNDHVTLEPGLLLHERLADRLALDAELRDWVPIDGSPFAGNILRYGVGLTYGQRRPDCCWVTPVAEVVGWTVLSGQEKAVFPAGVVVEDAAGDTIVNVKLGARLGFGDRADVYAGYGRPLTGDVWYKDTFRLEFRLLF